MCKSRLIAPRKINFFYWKIKSEEITYSSVVSMGSWGKIFQSSSTQDTFVPSQVHRVGQYETDSARRPVKNKIVAKFIFLPAPSWPSWGRNSDGSSHSSCFVWASLIARIFFSSRFLRFSRLGLEGGLRECDLGVMVRVRLRTLTLFLTR